MTSQEVYESDNFSLFAVTYENELMVAVKTFPLEYSYPFVFVPIIASKMLHSIAESVANNRNSFNKDSRAIKSTCKKLGIKHTYAAIKEYLSPKEK